MGQTPGNLADSSSLRVPPPLPTRRPSTGSPVHPVPPANFTPANTDGQPVSIYYYHRTDIFCGMPFTN